jgi:hypothetical protein
MAGRDFAQHRWRDPDWQAEILAWADAQLHASGRRRTGNPKQGKPFRAWSAVFSVPTDSGTVWLKANAIGSAHEGPLLEALARWCPDRVLAPIAIDARRGWLLLPDGGTTLYALDPDSTDLTHWEQILRDNAELQRTVSGHADEMVALGVPDVRPERLPEIRDDLLSDEAGLRLGRPDGLTGEQFDRLLADAPRYAALCAELAAIGVPASIQHDDLHDNNVFAPDRPGRHCRAFDWGDSSVAHPFVVLLIALRVVADRMKLPYGDAALLRLRDAYLEPWTADFDRPAMHEACRLALRVGGLSRALTYRSALMEGTPQDHEEFGDGMPQWLLEFYEPTPLEPRAD